MRKKKEIIDRILKIEKIKEKVPLGFQHSPWLVKELEMLYWFLDEKHIK